MKITDVEAMVLDTGKDYPNPAEASETHGIRYLSLIRITTDDGIVGWSDIETQPHVGRTIVHVPSGGQIGFESLRAARDSAVERLAQLRAELPAEVFAAAQERGKALKLGEVVAALLKE